MNIFIRQNRQQDRHKTKYIHKEKKYMTCYYCVYFTSSSGCGIVRLSSLEQNCSRIAKGVSTSLHCACVVREDDEEFGNLVTDCSQDSRQRRGRANDAGHGHRSCLAE